jgi:FkbM family methyltransferase
MYTSLPVRDRPPWHFRLAKWMIRHRIAGGYHLVELAERRGWLEHLVRFRLGGASLDVPMNRRENQWAEPDLLAYERPLVEQLAAEITRLPPPLVWIDCGADIGAVTALVVSRLLDAGMAPADLEVVAIEPNPGVRELLERNLSQLPCGGRAVAAAVADFAGRGRLADPPELPTAHSRFLAPDPQGEIEVVRLDDLAIAAGRPVAIKIDVEGGELAALRGAQKLLAQAPAWVVAFEANRDVFHRTGIDPCQCLQFLADVGGGQAAIAEAPELRLDASRPYFEQVPLRIGNVMCRNPRKARPNAALIG